MSVTIDDQTLEAEEMGLETVGHVLSHVQGERRLVVQMLIDGEEPDLDRIGTVRQSKLAGHTVYIETVDPSEMAQEVLGAVQEQLGEADRIKSEAADLIGAGQNPKAMEKLSGCFKIWQNAQESVSKTAQLLKFDLEQVVVEGRSLADLLAEFATQLRQIRAALESRDFVTLSDILTYETTQTTALWQSAVSQMQGMISS